MIPHDCAYFCCCKCFGRKISNVTIRFDQIHQLFHKILSINIILKSIKGHYSVEKFGKIMCISHNMDHISMHKQNIIKFHSLFLKIEILTQSRATTLLKSSGKFQVLVTILHTQNFIKILQFVLKILNGNKILTSIKGHNSVKNNLWLSIPFVNINAFTKFYQNPSIGPQDIEYKPNFNINQGP